MFTQNKQKNYLFNTWYAIIFYWLPQNTSPTTNTSWRLDIYVTSLRLKLAAMSYYEILDGSWYYWGKTTITLPLKPSYEVQIITIK